MKILITGRHDGVTEEMKDYARQKLEKLSKYFERATTAKATLDHVHAAYQVEMQFEVARGQTLIGKAEAADMFAACDAAEQKLGQQLRRFKDRLTDHHRGERRQAGFGPSS